MSQLPSKPIDTQLIVGAITAVSAITVLLLGSYLSHAHQRRAKRAEMYAEAFKTAVSWREMLYRVRRRERKPEASAELVKLFHDLQEKINFYDGWISIESIYVHRSYCRLVKAVKSKTEDLLNEAWQKAPRAPSTPISDLEIHPDLREESYDFLWSVRAHLSPSLFLWMKIALILRNRR